MTWSRNDLIVVGVGGRPVVDMSGMAISNGKGIFVSDGVNARFENLELVGASVGSGNGAGIRWEGEGALTVIGCVFRSNEDGILGGNHPDNTADVERNEFIDNSRGDAGFTHSVYFSEIDSVTFRGNWSHALYPGGSDVGHLFKSRAHHNLVLYNRLTAEDSPSSYEVNIPEGGEAYVIGNLIQQKVGGQRTVISFGDGDGMQYTGSKLYVANNTIVSESAGAATFVRTTQTDAQIVVVNNLIVGPGTLTSGGVVTMQNNVMTMSPGFVNQAGYDYHLVAGSPAIDAGADPGALAAMSLVPIEQYVQPAGTEPRGAVGALDVGAYEFGNTATPQDGNATGDDTVPPNPGGGGGCCRTAPGSGRGAGLFAIGVVALVLRRRRRR